MCTQAPSAAPEINAAKAAGAADVDAAAASDAAACNYITASITTNTNNNFCAESYAFSTKTKPLLANPCTDESASTTTETTTSATCYRQNSSQEGASVGGVAD